MAITIYLDYKIIKYKVDSTTIQLMSEFATAENARGIPNHN